MRVGVNLAFLRPGLVGGSEVYVRELVKRLQETQGVEVVLFGSENALGGFGLDIEKVVLWRGAYSRVLRIYLENTELRTAVNESGVEVLWSPGNFGVIARLGVPQVTTIHDLQHVRLPGNFTVMDRATRGLLFRLTGRYSARVVSISEFTRQEFIGIYKVPPDRVVAIRSGVDRSLIIDNAVARRRVSEIELAGRFFYYPAASYKHKNHTVLLRALRRLMDSGCSEVKLVLSGMRTPFWAKIWAEVEEMGLEKHVKHLGFVDRRTVFDLMACSAAVVFPSLFEGFGLPLLEAMQAETPVIAANTTAVPEIAGTGAQLVEATDVEGWMEAMSRALSDEEWRTTLIAAGTQNLERFSWETTAKELIDVFSGVVERSRSRAL